MACSLHSREKTHPALLITSAEGTPEWVSPLEALKLAVGLCNFTCCQRNHKFGDKIVPCDRGITRNILRTLILSKVKYLFDNGNVKMARMVSSLCGWWLRDASSPGSSKTTCGNMSELQVSLAWNEEVDGKQAPWLDRHDISILAYATIRNNVEVVRQILERYRGRKSHMFSWRLDSKGFVEFGMSGNLTCLHLGMCFANSHTVLKLLDAGSIPYVYDVMGNDPVMLASGLGRSENIMTWFANVSDWDVNRRNERFGSTALHLAVYLGPKKLKTVQYLIEKQGANVHIQNKSGSSALILACGNEDCDPNVVRYLVEKAGVDVNRQINSKTTMWKLMRATARFAVNSKMTRSKFLRRVAESSGLTALHYAARRGDMEIVELLLEHGAKPSIKNDLGRDVLS